MTNDADRPGGLGRLPAPDARDTRYPMSQVLAAAPPVDRVYRYWSTAGWWGHQGATAHCVAYAWLHWLEDGPITQPGPGPLILPETLYREAQERDEWPGNNYAGTSVRGGAKALQDRSLIGSYWWATSVDEIIAAILTVGPVVVGTKWTAEMDTPERGSGVMSTGGPVLGGHCYKLDGVNTATGYLRVKNSWGRTWGRRGFALVGIRDFAALFADEGEACIASELAAAV